MGGFSGLARAPPFCACNPRLHLQAGLFGPENNPSAPPRALLLYLLGSPSPRFLLMTSPSLPRRSARISKQMAAEACSIKYIYQGKQL